MTDIAEGRLRIPQFQREFVWTMKKSAYLLDSIIKGYPVGTFIIWRTDERLRSLRNIGKIDLPEPSKNEYVDYILDGQQRITSLYAALKGETVERDDGSQDDFSNIVIDLDAKDDEQIVKVRGRDRLNPTVIPLKTLYEGKFATLKAFDDKYHDKINDYTEKIKSYNYSVVQVSRAPIGTATEIFTRMNEGGTRLSTFEIMVAKTYDSEKGFDLAEKYKELSDNLAVIDYETLPNITILQLISLVITKECKRNVILSLNKDKVIDTWNAVADAVYHAAEYLRNYYRIPVSRLLPYNTLVVPLAYFFYKQKDPPNPAQEKYLNDFFWRVSLSGRYSSAVESKLAQDVKRIDAILSGLHPEYDWPIDTSADFIKRNGKFAVGRSYVKAILCIYAYHEPKSFENDACVNISNSWLKQINSKNYHHFFPRAYLKKKGVSDQEANHILNITIVDDYLNKRRIRDRPPSRYMKEFNSTNRRLPQTMKTHLINDLEKFGVWTNNYQKFLNMRADALSRAIGKRIIPQKGDSQHQPILTDDYEEPELE